MTLESRQSRLFEAALGTYLNATLHVKTDVSQRHETRSLPAYLSRLYMLFDVVIAGRRVVVLANRDRDLLVSEISKHVHIVRAQTGHLAAYAAATLSSRYRSRLIKEGISFIVPGKHLYLPELAIDLREQFSSAPPVEKTALSPAAQALLFYHLYTAPSALGSPSRIAEMLGYSAMTMTRAFDDLASHELASTERKGKLRQINFLYSGRELFMRALKLLRSPVREVRYIKDATNQPGLPLAGESALTARSELAPPRLPTYAVYAGAWKAFMRAPRKKAYDQDDADYTVEVWSYNPLRLSRGHSVDPLSLYVQFKDSADERVAAAAETMLREMKW